MTPFESLVESLSCSGITDEGTVRSIAAARNITVDAAPHFNLAPVAQEMSADEKALLIAADISAQTAQADPVQDAQPVQPVQPAQEVK